MNNTVKKKEVWGPWATIGFGLLIGLGTLVMQVIASIVYMIVLKISDPSLDIALAVRDLTMDGNFLCVSSLLIFPTSIALTALACWLRRGKRVRDYLTLQRVPLRGLLISLAIGAASLAGGGLLGFLLDEPTPEFISLSIYPHVHSHCYSSWSVF